MNDENKRVVRQIKGGANPLLASDSTPLLPWLCEPDGTA